jgi:hypothetical protein
MRVATQLAEQAVAREAAAAEAAPARPLPPAGSRPKRPRPSPKPADDVAQKAIEASVRGQLGAITRGDYRGALDFALPAFRDATNPGRFAEMVGRGYPVMTEVRSTDFARATLFGGESAVVNVTVSGETQGAVRYAYRLFRVRTGGERDGRWYVAEVAPVGPMTAFDGGNGGRGGGPGGGRFLDPSL